MASRLFRFKDLTLAHHAFSPGLRLRIRPRLRRGVGEARQMYRHRLAIVVVYLTSQEIPRVQHREQRVKRDWGGGRSQPHMLI